MLSVDIISRQKRTTKKWEVNNTIKCLPLNIYIEKERQRGKDRSQNNLIFHFNILEREEQTKPKRKRMKWMK